MKKDKTLSLKMLTKSTVWDVQENDIFRMWKGSEKDADLKDSQRHYLDVIRAAFILEELKVDKPEVIKKYEERGFKVGTLKGLGKDDAKWAVQKRPISRITDLTYENIRHISATQLLQIIGRNFGGGWESLSQSVKDIITSGFDVSNTTLPKDRMHNPGGIYDKMTADGYEVLEIAKGTWIEAIFAKAKPLIIKDDADDLSETYKKRLPNTDEENADGSEDTEGDDSYGDEDDFYEESLEQESYRTEYDEEPKDITLDDVVEAEDEY